MILVGVDMGRTDNKIPKIVLQRRYFLCRIVRMMLVCQGNCSEYRLPPGFPA